MMPVIFIVMRKENKQIKSISANCAEFLQGHTSEQSDRNFAALDLPVSSRLRVLIEQEAKEMSELEPPETTGEVLESGRMDGCQSTNHLNCYGELWQCGKCGKTVCCAEGTDNYPQLCDDCWIILHGG
jgi:hypothetical protein